jgi:hypothetical protein
MQTANGSTVTDAVLNAGHDSLGFTRSDIDYAEIDYARYCPSILHLPEEPDLVTAEGDARYTMYALTVYNGPEVVVGYAIKNNAVTHPHAVEVELHTDPVSA